MEAIRILHTADIHLDSSFSNLDKDKSTLRRKEQRQLLERIIRTAEKENAQLILIAGDLFDSDEIYGETLSSVTDTFSSTSLPIVITPGNHDCNKPGSAYSKITMPKNVFVFEQNKIECVELPSLNLRIWGAAFTDISSQSLMTDFSVEKKEGWLDIMCLHGEVGIKDSCYNAISEEQISASNMDYIALGHKHKCSGLKKAGNTYYAWPGCPEGRGFDETGEKSVYIADIDGHNVSIKQVCVCERKYVEESVYADELNDFFSNVSSADLLRVVLKGEVRVKPNINRLIEKYENKCFYLEIKDETRISTDLWSEISEDSLKGVFIGKMKQRFDSADSESEKQKILQAIQWGIAALENREGLN